MTTLMQRCQSLETKLKELARAKRYADDVKHIQQRTAEWRVRNAALKGIENQTSPLALAVEDAKKVASKRTALRQNAGKVLARLQENEDIKELTRDAVWTRLLNASEGLAEELDTAGRNAWRAYLEQQGTLENPATLAQRAPPTPQNESALRAYRESHASYSAIAKLPLPRTREDLVQLSMHMAACRQAFVRLTFDLPPEVVAFYQAIQAGTATLAHVTPTVLTWLDKEGHLERFRVRSVGQ
jgi:hypothetical protein